MTEGSFFQWRFEAVPIRILPVHGIATTEQTIAFRTTGNCAILVQSLCLHRVGKGLARSACRTLVGTEIYIVGASIARPFLTVSSAVTGRADAKDVSVQL